MSRQPSGGVAGKFLVFALLTLVAGYLLLRGDKNSINNKKIEAAQHVQQAGNSESRIPPELCPMFCEANLKQRIKHHGSDWMNPKVLLENAQKEREKMVDRLKSMYGEKHYQSIFHDSDGTRRKFFVGPNARDHQRVAKRLSEKRFQRKLALKLLRMQMLLVNETLDQGCECAPAGNNEHERNSEPQRIQSESNDTLRIVLPELKSTYEGVVWASGGHSAAASHGNLLHESYPEYMERMAKDVFRSVGLDLVGRNYAMGGMPTAPEVALCLEAKMGLDADIISWDSGMTEAGRRERFTFYGNRIGQHRNRPVFAAIQLGQGDDEEPKLGTMSQLEAWGMSTLHFPSEVQHAMHHGYPDMAELSGPEAEAVPEYAAYFVCKGMIEEGEPRCGELKYNETVCQGRPGKVAWHPGWKYQANIGHAMALFMADSLVEMLEEMNDAIEGMSAGNRWDPFPLYEHLKETEDEDYKLFMGSAHDLPSDLHDIFEEAPADVNLTARIPARAHSYCHSGHLPSESRYLGLFEGNFTTSRDDFDRGISFELMKLNATESTDEIPPTEQPMKLVFNPWLHLNAEDSNGDDCGEQVLLDFKDFLSATNKDGWTTVTFPNNLELEYYRPNEHYKTKGLVAMCFILCDWDDCPDGEINIDRFDRLEIEMNRQKVIGITDIGVQCGFLQNDKGFFFEADEKGQYRLRLRVGFWDESQPDVLSYVRITSLIVL